MRISRAIGSFASANNAILIAGDGQSIESLASQAFRPGRERLMEAPRHIRSVKSMAGLSVTLWWPKQMGEAASSGSSGGLRYAYFAPACRLLIEQQGQLTLYDTGAHHFRGVLQADGADGTLSFASQGGRVTLGSLKILSLAGSATVLDPR
jgi:hypothetical protein